MDLKDIKASNFKKLIDVVLTTAKENEKKAICYTSLEDMVCKKQINFGWGNFEGAYGSEMG